MARFSEATLDRVRQAADIVEVVSAHTDLRRQGDRWVGLCPFHEERTPSFSVNAAEKLYHCFGCQAGGDVFRFVQEKEGLGFPEAVELLADRYGVELEREKEDPRAEAARKRRARLRELLERTAGFYASYLWDSEEAARARDYLSGRGLGEEVLRGFGVGYAPSRWDSVLIRGQRAGFSVAELEGAGLAQRGRRGPYDRFRSRLMFPVRDARGRVVGFGARAMRKDQGAKYVNSPEGELYRKSATLYGIERARGPIARSGRAIVVEGYTDVLALHQAGVDEAVAVMGTAITDEQIAILSGLVDEVVLALDADRAGQDAMLRAQRVAEGRRMRIQVAAMGSGEDPAEMLAAEGGAERFRELVEGAVGLAEFQVRLVLEGISPTDAPAARDRALEELVPILHGVRNTVTGTELVRRAADRLGIGVDTLALRIEQAPAGGGRTARSTQGEVPEAKPGPAVPLTPRERRERALLAMCIVQPEEGREILVRLTPEHLSSPVTERTARWLREHLDEPLGGLPREDEELVSLVTQLVMLSEREPASLEAMELSFLQLEQGRLEDRIGEAGERGDYETLDELSRERAKLVERIAHAERVVG